MYDLSYVRRFFMAFAMVLAGVTGLVLLFPYWTPAPNAARPVAPRVVFLMHDQRTPSESAAVWSPALIALAGPGRRRSPADRVGSLAPPMKTPELRPLGIVRQGRASDEAGGESRWPWIWQLVGPPEFRVETSATSESTTESDGGGLRFYLPPDAPALDVTAAPLPEDYDQAFQVTVNLSFDKDGRALAVLLERPAEDQAINARLVRDAYRWRIPAGRAVDFRVIVSWSPSG